MTDTIPTFRSGDKVRVMQTDSMVAGGYANARGHVLVVWSEPDGIGGSKAWCRVQFADEAANFPASVLMKL